MRGGKVQHWIEDPDQKEGYRYHTGYVCWFGGKSPETVKAELAFRMGSDFKIPEGP